MFCDCGYLGEMGSRFVTPLLRHPFVVVTIRKCQHCGTEVASRGLNWAPYEVAKMVRKEAARKGNTFELPIAVLEELSETKRLPK